MSTALKQPLEAQQPITTVKQLHVHLYQAAQVELSTIPLYLYAAYSIQTAGDYQWDPGISAFRTIRSVVIEEMLHLCLVRNLMVATGAPKFAFMYAYDATAPAAEASIVLTAMTAMRVSLPESVEPGLNPNHPNAKMNVPRTTSGTLCPGIAFAVPSGPNLP